MQKNYKRSVLFFAALILLYCINISSVSAQVFEINAKSAILMDASTGKILYENNIHEAMPPASVTKIMTMLLTMETLEKNKISLQDQVVVSERASKMGGTQLYLEPGEIKTVEDLMKGIAIRSANDACVSIAEHISGSEDIFVQKMNERAKELGMKNTNFVNTNGLPAEGHVTSAYDVALMSRELLKHKEVQKWLTTWMDTVVVGKRESVQELVNTNKLIRSYNGITGIKTGYTSEAKHCLSASATRGTNSFIAVVLGAPTSPIRFSETAKLLDYGFANYNTVEVARKDQVFGQIQVKKGKSSSVQGVASKDIYILVKKGQENQIKTEVIMQESILAPVLAGNQIGELIVKLEGKEIEKIPIINKENIERSSILDVMGKMFRALLGTP